MSPFQGETIRIKLDFVNRSKPYTFATLAKSCRGFISYISSVISRCPVVGSLPKLSCAIILSLGSAQCRSPYMDIKVLSRGCSWRLSNRVALFIATWYMLLRVIAARHAFNKSDNSSSAYVMMVFSLHLSKPHHSAKLSHGIARSPSCR